MNRWGGQPAGPIRQINKDVFLPLAFMSTSFSSIIKTPGELTAAEQAAWAALCRTHAHLRNPFFSPGFTRAVGQAVSGARVCVILQAGQPVAFFPFQLIGKAGRIFRAAERLGGELSDYFGLVAAPGFTLSERELLGLCGLDYLIFSHLDDAQMTGGLRGEQPRTGLRIDLASGTAAYMQELRAQKKQMLRDTERRMRKVEQEFGALKFEFAASAPEPVIAQLIEAKLAQYARTGKRNPPLAEPWARQMLTVLARGGDETCRGVASSLYAGEQWVAFHFGLRAGPVLHYWFPVYNHALKAFAPGRLLLMKIIESADALGLREIDRGEGDSPAKRDFANAEHLFYRGCWYRPGPRSLAFRALQAARWRLKPQGDMGE
jgi:CelD/BcsL family acetyltransferase involved in cellulose biosynthesis